MSDDGLSAPNTKRGMLQRACLERLHQHEAEGALPTSGRFIFYELVQSGVIAKKRADGDAQGGRRADQDMIEALYRLREIGLVPWEWIVDERVAYQSGGIREVSPTILQTRSSWRALTYGVASCLP